ncbi:MAG TPA: nitrate- and nitrite sensing domain-containing protein [Pseudonocardiaceae bacterium]|nr:nitrate- and nitrite sensing domain-containing protein [Pseudonocardiaceae bacterium]
MRTRPPAMVRSPWATVLEASAAAVRRRGGRWRLRDWRLRTKLTAVLLIPLTLAGVLGGLRITDLVNEAAGSAALARQISFAQQLGVVVHDLQAERYRMAVIQAGDRAGDPAELSKQIQRVDSSVSSLRAAEASADALPAAAHDQWGPARRAVTTQLSGLVALRRGVRSPGTPPGGVSSRAALAGYSDVIAALLDLHRQALSGAPGLSARQADGIKALAVAQEAASWQHAVLQAGILTDGLSTEQQVMLRTAQARFDAAAAEFGQVGTPVQRSSSFQARVVTDRRRLLDAALEHAVRRAPLEAVPDAWNAAASATVEELWQGQITLLSGLRGDAVQRGDQALRQALRDGSVISVLLLFAVALLIVVVRSLLRPLRALRTAAFEVADRRLPEAIGQMRGADGAAGQARVDPVPVDSREEVGQVARAVDTVHAEAVRLAAEQAQLRSCLNDILLRLSGRNQGLQEQQLRLLQEARAQAGDPALLSRLDQLTGLALRMRRHSDNLLVIAGGTARRAADTPVPVLDVFSAAVAESDDGTRVTVYPPPALTVHAAVVTGLVHLLAELLDNAASAAPWDRIVTLGGSLTGEGALLVEITDPGEGMPAQALAAANDRLASPLDPADPPPAGQAGLFVVRELAAQYGISVRLRQRAGGSGITATVLLPPELVSAELVSAELVSAELASAESAGTAAPEPAPRARGEQAPLRVSVVEAGAGPGDAADLFSPGWLGDGPFSSSRPRTAQEEWLELFGSEAPPDPLAQPEPLAGNPHASGSAEVREQIFEMVSAWFREQTSAAASDSPQLAQTAWGSPFDEGWRAAQALRDPADHGLTEAGLPQRQPRAHLVSDVDSPLSQTLATAAMARTPDDVRNRLGRYQRGLRVGRHARVGPDEQWDETGTPARSFGADGNEYGPI